MTQQGVAPNVITYSAMISAYAAGNRLQRASELFEMMNLQGVVPNVITYSALISACEKGAQ